MIRIGKLPTAGLGIVAGGLLLGAGLAGYANPSPKAPPAPPWANQIEPPIAAGDAPISYVSSPEDLNPPSLADGYAPAVAFTRMRVPVDPPLPRVETGWESRWSNVRTSRDPEAALPADDSTSERAVPHYAALERAAAPRPAAADASEDDNAPVDANADSDALRSQADLAGPPPVSSGRPKVIHIASADDGD